jgi:hypothetical protein
MGHSGNRIGAEKQNFPLSNNDPYDATLYGETEAKAALAKRPEQIRCTKENEPYDYERPGDRSSAPFIAC